MCIVVVRKRVEENEFFRGIRRIFDGEDVVDLEEIEVIEVGCC